MLRKNLKRQLKNLLQLNQKLQKKKKQKQRKRQLKKRNQVIKMHSADIKPIPRHFLPKEFIIRTWEDLEPYFKDLDDRKIHSVKELEQWLKDASELEAVISEDACWRQIKM